MDKATFISLINVIPKKNGKFWVYLDYKKLNSGTIPNPFPLPFTYSLLDEVAKKDMYPFLDGFSGYKKVIMAVEDQEKTTFVTS